MAHEDLIKLKYYTVILHQLNLDGKGDSEEADSIRDKMDVWWYNLNPIEIAKINAFSADLHKYIVKETK